MAGISVVISASDNATGVIGKVNTGLDGLNRRVAAARAPMERMSASLGRFGQVSGISQAASDVGHLGRRIASAAGDLGRFAPALAGIVSAGSLAGFAALVNRWTEFGSKLGLDSRRIGIAADQLHGLQGAARLTGSSAEALTDGLETLGGNLVDAVGGRNAGVVQMLSTLGIGFQNASTGGARLAQDVLPEIADRISRIRDPFLQARAATALFGGAGRDLLPFLTRGAAGIREMTALAERYGLTNDRGVQGAREMARAQTQMGMAVEGVGYAISERVAPILVPMLDRLSDWIAANREPIAKFFKSVADGIKAWVDDGGLGRFLGRLEAVYKTLERIVGIADSVGHGLRKAWDSATSTPMVDDFGRPIPGAGAAGTPVPGLPTQPTTPGQDRRTWIQRNMPAWLGGLPSAGGGNQSTTFDRTLDHSARGLLDTIAGTESTGYDNLYGGGRFTDFSRHPNQAIPITTGPNAGQNSTAAGRYQFLKGTWDEAASALGLRDFTPASQDQAAWWLAQRDYASRTGRRLSEDLHSTDVGVLKGVGQALHSTWTSLPGGIEAGTSNERFVRQLQANTAREATGVATYPPPGPRPPLYGSPATPLPVALPVQPAPTPIAGSPGAQGQPGPDGKATVRLMFDNAPAGLKAKTLAEGGLRIETPMLGNMP